MPSIKGITSQDAGVVKLVYTTDSKSVAFGRGGSSPPTGTILKQKSLDLRRGFFVCCNIKAAHRDIVLGICDLSTRSGCCTLALLLHLYIKGFP